MAAIQRRTAQCDIQPTTIVGGITLDFAVVQHSAARSDVDSPPGVGNVVAHDGIDESQISIVVADAATFSGHTTIADRCPRDDDCIHTGSDVEYAVERVAVNGRQARTGPDDGQCIGNIQVTCPVLVFTRPRASQGVGIAREDDRVGAAAGFTTTIRGVCVGCLDGFAQGTVDGIGGELIVGDGHHNWRSAQSEIGAQQTEVHIVKDDLIADHCRRGANAGEITAGAVAREQMIRVISVGCIACLAKVKGQPHATPIVSNVVFHNVPHPRPAGAKTHGNIVEHPRIVSGVVSKDEYVVDVGQKVDVGDGQSRRAARVQPRPLHRGHVHI